MKSVRIAIAMLGAGIAVPAGAQLSAPVRNGESSEIIVIGRKEDPAEIAMSDWRVAETPHVILFGRGEEKTLIETAHNLEALHFLLSVLLNRVDRPDETVKVRLTMIGDSADFDQLRLASARWQYGPYARTFHASAYYDPREDGPVIAAPGNDVKAILQPASRRPTNPDCAVDDGAILETVNSAEANAAFPLTALDTLPFGEVSVCQTATGRLYGLFAQNYLLTYFPAAYPRWYLQGFGEIFATMIVGEDGTIEYGRAPQGFRQVIEHFGRYAIDRILAGEYLTGSRRPPEWTPYHAWALAHLLFFSDEWHRPLHDYLAAVASGKSGAEAARALGDVDRLRRELGAYHGRKVPFERMTYPADRVPAPVLRRLTRSEAALVRGRLELGARIDGAAAGGAEGLARRDAWLARLRDNARRFPEQLDGQLLLAEAECRSGNPAECLTAADRAVALAPNDPTALLWKGEATVRWAIEGTASERSMRLKEGRALIVRANRMDNEALLPLTAYYRSFTTARERASDAAVAGLAKAVDAVPAAPGPRPDLGQELAARGEKGEARRVLLPVARGAFDSPEKPKAATLLGGVSP